MFLPTHVSRPSYCLKSPYRHLLLENLTVPLSGKSVGFQERIFLGFADCGILYFPGIFPDIFLGTAFVRLSSFIPQKLSVKEGIS
jgi:hypothetical protein